MPTCPWSDSDVSDVTNAALLVQLAEKPTPGLEAVRAVADDWRRVVSEFSGAITDARGPAVRKHRLALKKMSSRVYRRIDVVALATRLAASNG